MKNTRKVICISLCILTVSTVMAMFTACGKEKEEERRTKREARKAEREAARQKSEQEQPAEKIIGWWEKIRHKNEKKTDSEVKEQMTENIAKDKNESAE